MLKKVFAFLLTRCFRLQVQGLENYHKAGKRVLIIANHLSFLDALLLAVVLPDRLMFAVNTDIAKRWYFKPFIALVQSFRIDPTNPMATRSIIQEIRKDKKCVIFPEGRITLTGSLMKIYKGSAMIADKSQAVILPIRIEGAEYSLFSRLKGKVRRRIFPKIRITILPPTDFSLDENLKGRKRLHAAGIKLYNMMSDMLFITSALEKTLYQSLLEQVRVHGRKHIIGEDIQRSPVNYGQFLIRCFALGTQMAKDTQYDAPVGILLPNTVTTMACLFALQIHGRIPAMLNFSAGTQNLLSACKTAHIHSIYTSKKFIEAASLSDTITLLQQEHIVVHYLEDVATRVGVLEKLRALAASYFPQSYVTVLATRNTQSKAHTLQPELETRTQQLHMGNKTTKQNTADFAKTAVILFTSGSEGLPKGVMLSHKNLQANRYQIASRIDFGPQDIIFNALPLFHSFGLTAGALLPILSGIRTFFYPSPLHYRTVPELIYDTSATIMFGTDTFLAGYAKFAHPYDFYSIRYAFAGAEKLKDNTRKIWAEKFGVRVFEGYGATETAPVLSLNTPTHYKAGTVGRLLPYIEHTLTPVQGIASGGRLVVSGPNIMQGYLLADNPGVLVPTHNQTYDTGDIVDIDEEGYVTILGRAKRFAKIAGEMVSLTAVENFIADLWPTHIHAVLSLPDSKKGEALLLLTTNKEAQRKEIIAYANTLGIGELSLPKQINIVESIPLLATGKVDYVQLQKHLYPK